MASKNETTIRRHFEALFNNGTVLAELFADDYVGHGATDGAPDFGVSNIQQTAITNRAAFPDLRATLEDLIDGGDRVVARYTILGTHEGTYQGIAPTGTAARVRAISIYRLADGKIAESWQSVDTAGLLRQLGVLPSPTPASA